MTENILENPVAGTCPQCKTLVKPTLEYEQGTYHKYPPMMLYFECKCPGVELIFHAPPDEFGKEQPEMSDYYNKYRTALVKKCKEYFKEYSWDDVIKECEK